VILLRTRARLTTARALQYGCGVTTDPFGMRISIFGLRWPGAGEMPQLFIEATRPHRVNSSHADATKGAGEHTSPAPRVARYPSGYAWAASAATKAGAFGVPQPVVAS
jgi:hypothetical protein